MPRPSSMRVQKRNASRAVSVVTFPGEHDFCSKKLSKNVDDDAMEYGTHSSMAAKYAAVVPHSGATRAPESELKQSHHHNILRL